MDSDTGERVRRAVDRTEHQQNGPEDQDRLDSQREYGDSTHQSKRHAASEQTKFAMGQNEDPDFVGTRTVPVEATQRPVTISAKGVGEGPQLPNTKRGTQVLCGPLINYRRMSKENTDGPIWHGSILVVTTAGTQIPDLELRNADGSDASTFRGIKGERLYEDPKSCFWRFEIQVPFLPQESKWEYHVPGLEYVDSEKTVSPGPKIFAVPSKYASMRIMFHSCNGFSAGTDTEAWSGCALWNDVLRQHKEQPFHVMLGGGDQIYNDGVRVDGPLRPWSDMASPVKRRNFPFNEELRAKCDSYYFDSYIRWYGTEPFSFANCQIPQVNIWDDHDIIDGFGSYTDNFMQCDVFRGIGGIAHKYYLLFQHHLPPPMSTYTSDAPQTTHADEHGTTGADAVQLRDSYVMKTANEDPSYIIGKTPGPYVEERSRSIYCQLGARIALMGVDARTERTRHQVNYPETYDQIFTRTSRELESNPNLRHLIVLLGIPIAYPRLQWLENILQSPIIGPIRFLNKRFGLAGGFFNHFDGNVDILDDLDDHYTSHQHKKERRELIQRLQGIAKKHNVRVTILGGDVHLAALGRFYSNPKLGLPIEKDHRYMPNIISSAITNKPPPHAVANLLAKRNKIHHLDSETDETMLNIFNRDPGTGQGKAGVPHKTKDSNHCTMPSRNYAIINESHDLADETCFRKNASQTGGTTNHDSLAPAAAAVDADGWLKPPGTANGSVTTNGTSMNNATTIHSGTSRPGTANSSVVRNGHGNPRNAMHAGEDNAGTEHPASSGLTRTGLGGEYGLDVAFRVEISPSDREGHTDGYGITIPALER